MRGLPMDNTMVINHRPQGWMAPAMLLLGRMLFPAKATLICLVFLVPMAFMLLNLYWAQQSQIDFVVKERHGVRVLSMFYPVIHGVLDMRNAARAGMGGHLDTSSDLQTARRRVDSALLLLEQEAHFDGDPLGIAADVLLLQQAFAATADSGNSTDATGSTAFDAVTNAADALIHKIGDNSNLVLDPDMDSFYLMNGLVITLPRALANLGQLWEWGTYALQKGALNTVEAKRYAILDAGAAMELQDTKDHFAKAIRYTASLASKVPVEGIDQALRFRELAGDISQRIASGQTAGTFYASGKDAIAAAQSVYPATLTALDELLAMREERMAKVLWVSLALIVIAIVLALYLLLAFYRVMHQGLSQVGSHLHRIAHGDLRAKPQMPWAKDELAELIVQLAITHDSLHDLIISIRGDARDLQTASDEIAAASQDLSGRTESSAAALEEQSSAMEQILSTVGHAADLTQKASECSAQNANIADRAGMTIANVVTTMQDIHTSSSKINDIIGVIDSIAFQTNILALNAAVEAARAGEQGRGFAVVASEVRSLAQRSANAAKEIKVLISESVEKIGSGTDVVQVAGNIMRDVVSSAKQVHTLLAKISAASQEQTQGIDQVGQSIQELDRATQQNAALAEETTASASTLKVQADKLHEEILRFQVA